MGLMRIGPKLSFCLAWALIPIKKKPKPPGLGLYTLHIIRTSIGTHPHGRWVLLVKLAIKKIG